jgi:hypothetical protein
VDDEGYDDPIAMKSVIDGVREGVEQNPTKTLANCL